MSDAEMKTTVNDRNVLDFISEIDDEQKRQDSLVLLEMMQDVSGHEPRMWGPSIVGFDSYHYKYDSGREGDMCVIGFSPRKANLTLYITEGFEDFADLLEKLGKHTTSVVCLYIKRLSDVDVDVLKQLIERAYKTSKTRVKSDTVDGYQATVPDIALGKFKELRALVQKTLPDATETISYAIPAYKIDGKPVVYISGWKDHVALYPVPHDEAMRKKLEPYQKGKGTLWFALDEPLPKQLIEQTIKALLVASEKRGKRY
jgi:uncharacterized protein YdhG (YjbR/CyaY superfamily)